MERSWLVQRLQKPRNFDNPFSFGGGYKNGGLTDEAMDMLRGIFSFDYMGAAEFEFGALPKALQKIAKLAEADELAAFEISIPVDTVEADFRDKGEAPEGDRTIYVLARSEDDIEVDNRIRGWASEQYNSDLKESTRLAASLRPYRRERDGETVGWLELNNGFMFFTDEDMWAKTAALFGVDTGDRESA